MWSAFSRYKALEGDWQVGVTGEAKSLSWGAGFVEHEHKIVLHAILFLVVSKIQTITSQRAWPLVSNQRSHRLV